MKLEIGAFHVKDIKFGDKTAYSAGVLTVNKEELIKVAKEDEHITTADFKIVHPGDNVVLCPVKEAVEMRCKSMTFRLLMNAERPINFRESFTSYSLSPRWKQWATTL